MYYRNYLAYLTSSMTVRSISACSLRILVDGSLSDALTIAKTYTFLQPVNLME